MITVLSVDGVVSEVWDVHNQEASLDFAHEWSIVRDNKAKLRMLYKLDMNRKDIAAFVMEKCGVRTVVDI